MFALLLAAPLLAATLTVNDMGDVPDAAPIDGICATAGSVCTLRDATPIADALAGTQRTWVWRVSWRGAPSLS